MSALKGAGQMGLRCRVSRPRVGQVRPNVRLLRPLCAQPAPTRPVMPIVEPPVDPWKQVLEAEQKGDSLEAVVQGFNKGGLVVAVGELKGFVPYNQLASSSLKKGHMGDMSFLVGQKLKTKVVSVDVQSIKKDLVLSEKKAVQSEVLQRMKVGDTMRGVISHVEEYGVFVDLLDLPGVSGMVHKSEVSWSRVVSLESAVTKGKVINVKVLEVDPVKCRLSLSIKQLLPDPLKQTLDTLEWGPTKQIPADIQKMMDRLSAFPGIEQVMIMRQAKEEGHFSQELQVFMTKEEDSSNGIMIVARLGSILQEMQLATELPRKEIKEVLQRVVKG